MNYLSGEDLVYDPSNELTWEFKTEVDAYDSQEPCCTCFLEKTHEKIDNSDYRARDTLIPHRKQIQTRANGTSANTRRCDPSSL